MKSFLTILITPHRHRSISIISNSNMHQTNKNNSNSNTQSPLNSNSRFLPIIICVFLASCCAQFNYMKNFEPHLWGQKFAATGWCCSCWCAFPILLFCIVYGVISFFGSTVCVYLDDLDGQKLSGTLTATGGSMKQSNINLFDACMSRNGNGEMLKVFEQESCPKNATTGTYRDSCLSNEKIMISVHDMFMNKIIGKIDGAFKNIPPVDDLPKMAEALPLLTLVDNLKLPMDALTIIDPTQLAEYRKDTHVGVLAPMPTATQDARFAAATVMSKTGSRCADYDLPAIAGLGTQSAETNNYLSVQAALTALSFTDTAKIPGVHSAISAFASAKFPVSGANMCTNCAAIGGAAVGDCFNSDLTCANPTGADAMELLAACKAHYTGVMSASDVADLDALVSAGAGSFDINSAAAQKFFSRAYYGDGGYNAAEYQCNPCNAAKNLLRMKKNEIRAENTAYTCKQPAFPTGHASAGAMCTLDPPTSNGPAGIYTPDCVVEKSPPPTEPTDNRYTLETSEFAAQGSSCSFPALSAQFESGDQFSKWLYATATRLDSETERLQPLIVGERSRWDVTPITSGSGVWGMVSEKVLNPLEYDLLYKINCKFVSKAFYKLVDAICYLGIFGFIQMSEGTMTLAMVCWVVAITMKLIWRTVADNKHARHKRGEDVHNYTTKKSVHASAKSQGGEAVEAEGAAPAKNSANSAGDKFDGAAPPQSSEAQDV